MQECLYCQYSLEEKDAFKISSPDGKEFFVCAECQNDVFKFFSNKETEVINQPELALRGIDNTLVIHNQGNILNELSNVSLHNVEIKQLPTYELSRNQFYFGRAFQETLYRATAQSNYLVSNSLVIKGNFNMVFVDTDKKKIMI